MSNELNPKAVGARVRLLRLSKGIRTQKQMAALVGAEFKQFNNWENGIQIIPVAYAVKLAGLTGATLDFIYQNNKSALPMHLVTYLSAPPEDK